MIRGLVKLELIFPARRVNVGLGEKAVKTIAYRLKLIVVEMISIVYSLFTTKHILCVSSNAIHRRTTPGLPRSHLPSLVYTVNVMMRHLLYLKNEPFFMRLIRNFISARDSRFFSSATRLCFCSIFCALSL